jgi:hypothetical protein
MKSILPVADRHDENVTNWDDYPKYPCRKNDTHEHDYLGVFPVRRQAGMWPLKNKL